MRVTTAACGRRGRVGGGGATIVVALCAMCLLEACCSVAHGHAEQPTATATAAEQQVHRPHDDAANTELLKQVLTKKCMHRYTMTCLKLDLVRFIDRLGTTRTYPLMPGISLVRSVDGNHTATGNHNQQQQQPGNSIPAAVVRSLVRSNESADELNGYLMEKMDAYLNSLSISVKLIDSSVVENVRKMGSQMLSSILPTNLLTTGRGKKHGMHAALWSAGTLAAIAFAALAALAGKALMTALLALALAAMCALKGHGGGGGGGGYGKTSHYEIITKPAIYDHDHLVHGASYSSAPYSYARHLQQSLDDGGGGGGGGGGGYHGVFGRIPLHAPPQRVSVVHAAPVHGAVRPHDTSGGGGDAEGPSAGDPSGPGGHPGPSSGAAGGGGDEDIEDDATVGHMQSYPLTPITYIPTNNA